MLEHVDIAAHDRPFKQWMLPVLLKTRDLESLTFLMKQPDCLLHPQDFTSFVLLASPWLPGMRAFLASKAAHFTFQSRMSHEEQLLFARRVVEEAETIGDPRVKRTLQQTIIEDILCRRPYVRAVTIAILEKGGAEPKMAKECLKSLTSEDLWQMRVDAEGFMETCCAREWQPEVKQILKRYEAEAATTW